MLSQFCVKSLSVDLRVVQVVRAYEFEKCVPVPGKFLGIVGQDPSYDRENRPLVTDEPVEFEK